MSDKDPSSAPTEIVSFPGKPSGELMVITNKCFPNGLTHQVIKINSLDGAKLFLSQGNKEMEWEGGELRRITADTPEGVKIAGEIAQAQIRSRTIMKLGLYGLSAFFCAVAALIIVFAPAGKENVSAIVAAALFVLAVGSAGFSAFALKGPLIKAEANSSK